MFSMSVRNGCKRACGISLAVSSLTFGWAATSAAADPKFQLEEATIAQIQEAILAKQITSTDLVNALSGAHQGLQRHLREAARRHLGPDRDDSERRSDQRAVHAEPAPRRAEEQGLRRAQGAQHDGQRRQRSEHAGCARNRRRSSTPSSRAPASSSGPLHGVVMAIKDQYDTFDMRTTSGADAFYANDRPPDDSTFVARLRAAGAIILAKSNLGEYASATPRSSFGGTFCNPYDTQRIPRGSSSGSGSSVGANMVTCAIAEESGLVDSRPGQRGERGRYRGHRGAREPRRHDSDRHQHARRPDLPHGRGCGAKCST